MIVSVNAFINIGKPVRLSRSVLAVSNKLVDHGFELAPLHVTCRRQLLSWKECSGAQ